MQWLETRTIFLINIFFLKQYSFRYSREDIIHCKMYGIVIGNTHEKNSFRIHKFLQTYILQATTEKYKIQIIII